MIHEEHNTLAGLITYLNYRKDTGHPAARVTPEGLIWTLQHKLDINLSREWPEPSSPDSPGEHNRSADGTK